MISKLISNKRKLLALTLIILIAFSLGASLASASIMQNEMKKNIEEKNQEHSSLMKDIQEEMREKHSYQCCLMKACASCVSLSPWHGEGAACTCLEDIVNGKAPCGECLGGILAGRGNIYLKEYFTSSIVDEVGEEYRADITAIIEKKYPDKEE